MTTTTADETTIEIDLRERATASDPVVLPAGATADAAASDALADDDEGRAGERRSLGSTLLTLASWAITLALLGVLFVPTLLGFSRYAIVGGSMQGTYDKYSLVYEKPVPVEGLEVGDVITYVPPPIAHIDTLVTHRIIGIEQTEDGRPLFETKGDANVAADPHKFTLDQPVQNVVRFSVPWVGWILIKLSDPDVRQLVIGIPAAIIALGAVAEMVGLRPRRRQGEDPAVAALTTAGT